VAHRVSRDALGRVVRNAHAERWLGREVQLLQHVQEESARYAAARERGDFDVAAVIAGEVLDLINDTPPAQVVVERIAAGAVRLLSSAAGRLRDDPT
jgi:nitronate monooxygenase